MQNLMKHMMNVCAFVRFVMVFAVFSLPGYVAVMLATAYKTDTVPMVIIVGFSLIMSVVGAIMAYQDCVD